jgi:hypothetical protein
VKYDFIRDKVEAGIVKIQPCTTANMITDSLIKPIDAKKFLWCRHAMAITDTLIPGASVMGRIDTEQPGSCHSSLSTSETETPWPQGVVEYRPCPPSECKGDSRIATSAANCSSQMDVAQPVSAAMATGLRLDAVRNNHD